jgi:hypothetical protein
MILKDLFGFDRMKAVGGWGWAHEEAVSASARGGLRESQPVG